MSPASTQPSQTPAAIPDLETGLQMLSLLPLANLQQADVGLNSFFDSLLKTPPETSVYLELLEESREPLCFVEEELARRYTDKPLPLSYIEEGCLRQVIATWLKAARAYAHCAVRDKAPDDSEHASRIALMMQRCIYYTGMAMIEHQRARRQLPPGLWDSLHGYYATAEKWGVATQEVHNALDSQERKTNCAAAFISLLLSELAGPYSLSMRDQNLVRRWANSWAPLVSMHPAVPGEPLPGFIIDLSQDIGLLSSTNCQRPPEKLRILDTSRLAAQLKQFRQQLKQKISPAQIGLGHDCKANQCNRLLKLISRPWSQVHVVRKFRRRDMSGIAKLCLNTESMHYAVSNQMFSQPNSAGASADQAPPDFTVEQWSIVNQSANGFRLMRQIVGKKIAHGQLLALCPNEGGSYLLAQTTWLMQEYGGNLIAGVAVLPGKPQAIAARLLAEAGEAAEPYSRAFGLPAVPAVEVEQSLLIPHGWYRTGRIIEVFTTATVRVKLKQLIDDGPDFDRASFVIA